MAGIQTKRSRIGIFGGSFNPPHLGHIHAVKKFTAKLNLETIIVLPSAKPFYKDTYHTEYRHRFIMCQTGFIGAEKVIVSDLERLHPFGMYTYDVVKVVQDFYSNNDIFLLMGSDVLNRLPQWKGIGEILKNVQIGVLHRGGTLPETADLVTMGAKIRIVPDDTLPISSSMIRDAVARGEAFETMVPASVAQYIKVHGLYKNAAV